MYIMAHMYHLQAVVHLCTVQAVLCNTKLTAEDQMEQQAQEKGQRETRGRSNRRPKIHNAGKGKGIFFIWEALLVFEAWDLNVEQYEGRSSCSQNAMQCYHEIYEEKRWAMTQTSLDRFFKRVDRTESSKEQSLYHQHQAWGNCSWPSISYCCQAFSSATSISSPPQSVLSRSVHALPAPICQLFVLCYCTFQGPVL